MNGVLYGIALQLKLDIRSKNMLVTCYMVPLIFYLLMGGIFTSVMPDMKETLVQSMTVMGVSMGACIGLPQSVAEVYGGDIKKVYQANGVPVYLGLLSMAVSAFIHLYIVSVIIYAASPLIFKSSLPWSQPSYFLALAIFIVVSVVLGALLGLLVKNQSKLTMISQIVFLPSIMLSGIMFPSGYLSYGLRLLGSIFPASWGYRLMLNGGLTFENLLPLTAVFLVCIIMCFVMLKRRCKSE